MVAIYRREETHGKVEKAELSTMLFFIPGLYKENADRCAAGCTRQADRHRGKKLCEERGRETDTYPWQCFLFMEGVLGFDGRLSGAVGEKCTAWNTGMMIKI